MSCSMCERSEKAMEQRVDLSETLKDIYTLQCRADLDTDHFYVFQAQPAIKAELDKKQNAVQCMEHLTEKYVAPEYRNICRDFYDLSTTVNLPLAINKAAVTAVRPSDSPAQDILRGTTILLVEDNALNAEVAEFLLEHAGASVLKAWNGQEGVEQFLRSSPGEIDAILMDVMMPVLDGLSAARRLRALDRPDAKTIPIVAMTANAFVDDMEKTREAGMNAHLSKPLDSKKLLTVLAKLIQKE